MEYRYEALFCIFTFFCGVRLVQGQDGGFCNYGSITKIADCDVPSITFNTIPNDLPDDVQIIHMTSNAIASLYPGNLTYYSELLVLNLDDNLITDIQAGLASEISSIEELNFNENPLITIQDGAFENLTNLNTLYLRSTDLKNLTKDMFLGLVNLKILDLDGSKLNNLPEDLFSHLSGLDEVVLTNNELQTVPEGIFEAIIEETEIYLEDNPWSCDCNLDWISFILDDYPTFPADRDSLFCEWPERILMTDLDFTDFKCYPPNITINPSNDSILTNRTYTLVCEVTGAPFPDITWYKDGEAIEYSNRLYLNLFDGSLHFSQTILLQDEGVYQCEAKNEYGTVISTEAILSITESTCFDGLLSPHESDIDCGGIYCTTCNYTYSCKVDSDCTGDLVCLYAFELPSQLHYISPANPRAYTCDFSTVPKELLDARLQNAIPIDVFSQFNFSVNNDLNVVQDTLITIIADVFSVSESVITKLEVKTVERTSSQSEPLIQIWFNLAKNAMGREARESLLQQIDDGDMKGTIRISEESSYYHVRINI